MTVTYGTAVTTVHQVEQAIADHPNLTVDACATMLDITRDTLYQRLHYYHRLDLYYQLGGKPRTCHDAIIEDLEWILHGGTITAADAAQRIGLSPRQLRRICTTKGRRDLWVRLEERP